MNVRLSSCVLVYRTWAKLWATILNGMRSGSVDSTRTKPFLK